MQLSTGYVGLIDALGVATYDSNQCLSFLEGRNYCIERTLQSLHLSQIEEELLERGFDAKTIRGLISPKVLTFGDTIIFLWNENAFGENLIDLVLAFLDHYLTMHFYLGVMFRGALTRGEFVYDGQNTVIGPAVAEAASFYEGHDSPTIILSDRIQEELRERLQPEAIVEGQRTGRRGRVIEKETTLCKKAQSNPISKRKYLVAWPAALLEMPLETLKKKGCSSAYEYFDSQLEVLGTKTKHPKKYQEAKELFECCRAVLFLP